MVQGLMMQGLMMQGLVMQGLVMHASENKVWKVQVTLNTLHVGIFCGKLVEATQATQDVG